MHDNLQITIKESSSAPVALIPCVGGGSSNKKTRRELLSPRRHKTEPNTIPTLKKLLHTYTDEKCKEVIKNLPQAWQEINEKGTIFTKRQLQVAVWGEYKDDHIALQF
jgi:hypothetical protein